MRRHHPAMPSRLACAAAGLVLALLPPSGAARADAAAPVVVELFTSQGCSSCPPADAYLGELAERADVLALAFHVDYWNYIGWTDPFASPASTQRQRVYAKRFALPYVYTPQIVVDGAAQAIGSERAAVEKLIAAAAKTATPRPALAILRRPDGAIAVHVGAAQGAGEPATVWLLGIDRQRETRVLSGENGGRRLVDHQIVRRIEDLGTWRGAALDLAVPAPAAAAFAGEDVAALLQEGGSGSILAAGRLPAPR